MARIQRNHGFALLAAGTMLVGVIATGGPGLAQGPGGRVVDQAQRAVRERITSREGGHHLIVRFEGDARTDARSKADVWVVGTGTVVCSDDGRTRTFSYDAIVKTRYGHVSESHYDWRGDWYTIAPPLARHRAGRPHDWHMRRTGSVPRGGRSASFPEAAKDPSVPVN